MGNHSNNWDYWSLFFCSINTISDKFLRKGLTHDDYYLRKTGVVKQPAVGRDGSHTTAVRFRSPHKKSSLTFLHTKHSIERQTSINNKTYTNLNPSKITWYKPILLLEEKKSGCKSIGDLRCENITLLPFAWW